MKPELRDTRVLVTGASGYVGGALVDPLLEAGAVVRVLARTPEAIAQAPWREKVQVIEGNATNEKDLDRALNDIDVAYYLLHSMDGDGDLAERDRAMAQRFVAAAHRAGVRRIVYLGGMHPSGDLSEHLASRAEVGQIFLTGEVPAVVLQAAVILGAGSASFQMLRYLAGRLPAMVTPKWLNNRLQPIAIDDVLHYLVGAATLPGELNRSFDIGGPEVLTYAELIQRFARVTGRHRRLIATVPVLTPRLASYWVGAVTPVDTGVARPLVGSLIHEVVAAENDIRELLPAPRGLLSIDSALRSAEAGNTPDTALRNLVFSGTLTAVAAVLGSLSTDPNSRWYRRLRTPDWQPPRLTFPIVWSGLYADIALTSAATLTELDRQQKDSDAANYRKALLVNLALNTAWSVTFFRAHKLRTAAGVSAALTASSADLARRASSTGAARGWALFPYAAWTGFATALSAAIARRNR